MDGDALIAVGFIALVAGVVLVLFLLEQKRNKQIQELAKRLHMTYTKKPDSQMMTPHKDFHLFNQGRSRKKTHLMERSLDHLNMSYFEYSYVTGHGKHRTTHRQSVLKIDNQKIILPAFSLEPECFFHRIADKFSGKDIDFECHPTFSKMFLLKGDNESSIRALFSDEIIRFLEGCKGVCIEACNQQIIFYRKNRRCSVKQVEAFIRNAMETYAVLTKTEA